MDEKALNEFRGEMLVGNRFAEAALETALEGYEVVSGVLATLALAVEVKRASERLEKEFTSDLNTLVNMLRHLR